MKWDRQHIALVLAPVVLASLAGGVDYLQNNPHPFDKQTLIHAGLATLLVFLALLKNSVLKSSVTPLVLLALLLSTGACGGTQAPSPAVLNSTAEQVAVAAYGEEQLQCAAYAGSKQQGELCIYQVNAWWCGHGLPRACHYMDGGAE